MDWASFAGQNGWVQQGLASADPQIYSLALLLSAQSRGLTAVEPLREQWRSEAASQRRAAILLALAAANAPAAVWAGIRSELPDWPPLESAAWVHAVVALRLRGPELDLGLQWAKGRHPWVGVRQAAGHQLRAGH